HLLLSNHRLQKRIPRTEFALRNLAAMGTDFAVGQVYEIAHPGIIYRVPPLVGFISQCRGGIARHLFTYLIDNECNGHFFAVCDLLLLFAFCCLLFYPIILNTLPSFLISSSLSI